MPRDGLSQYAPPPGTNGITNYTIESTKYNGFVADVTQDLNLPRPIVAGGTGANNAHDAMIALSGEIATQGPVTNYDTFPFVNGSFYSNAGATAAPDGANAFVGTYYAHANPNYAFIEVRNVFAPALTQYTRWKNGGVWQPWAVQPGSLADLDAAYVNVAGDTMTGALTAPRINVGSSAIPNAWPLTVKTGPNANFGIFDSGAGTAIGPINDIGTAFQPWQLWGEVKLTSATGSTSPTTGALTVAGGVGVSGAIYGASLDGGAVTSHYSALGGTYYFGTSGTKYLTYDGTDFQFAGGRLNVSGNTITVGNTGTTGYFAFGNTGTKYLNYDGTNFNLVGGNFTTASAIAATTTVTATTNLVTLNGGVILNSGGNVYLKFDGTNFFYSFAGTTYTVLRGGDGALIHNYSAYKPGGGVWADSSDSRIKNVEGDYTRGLEEIAGLRPIYFTFKGNETDGPPSHPTDVNGELLDAKLKNAPVTVPYPNSNHAASAKAATKYAGLIAQEVEAIFPEMVTKRSAYIDGQPVDDLRDLDTTPLIFALVNAVKELKAEVDALKAAR